MSVASSNYAALVTGASSGLGFECVRLLRRRGIPVVMVARGAGALAQAVARIGPAGAGQPGLYPVAANVGNEADIRQVKHLVEGAGLTLKWLINSAGVGHFGDFGSYSRQMIDEILEGNLIGMILVSQTFLSELIANQGVLCNVISTLALTARPREAVYTAAKWGARGLTEALRAEFKDKPVRIMAVYPGGMNTPFWEERKTHLPDRSKYMPPAGVAERIISNMLDAEQCQVNDLTINRLYWT